MYLSNPDIPDTWIRFKPSLCKSCVATCCTMPLEVDSTDLARLGVISSLEEKNLKNVAKSLIKAGLVESYRVRTGKFLIKRTATGRCPYLTKTNICSVYENRPKTCREFPHISSRPGHCPYQKKNESTL